ncbi:MAG: putative sulfoacetate transporter SauU [Legionellaceae bacterium]
MMKLKSNHSFILAWIVWGLGATFYFYDILLQVSPGVMVPELMQAFNVNAASLGQLSAFYFYAYAGMQIPVGVLLDNYGPRRLLSFAALICLMGCLLFGYADGMSEAALGRFFIGFGSAFGAVGCMKLASNWFPHERFAFLTGLLVALGMLGAVGGETPLALLINAIGWHKSMVLLGLVGGIIAVCIWFIVKDSPVPMTKITSVKRKANILAGLKQVTQSKQTWLAAIYGGLMFAPTSAFGALWGVPFLIEKYGITRPTAAGVISLLFIGWAIGSPISGWISDTIQRRKPSMIIGTIFSLFCILAIIYAPVSLITVSFLLFFFGFFSSGFLTAFSIVREINHNHISATALGFMNMLNMIGGAILQPLIGYLLDRYWNGVMIQGARQYSIENYHTALAVLPAIIFISLLLIPFIKETYCKAINTTHDMN